MCIISHEIAAHGGGILALLEDIVMVESFNMSISIVNDSQHHRNRMGLQINVG